MKYVRIIGCGILMFAVESAGAQTAAPTEPPGSTPASAGPQTASTNAAIEEIVVTANKRLENQQDVPVSLTAISGQALQDQGIQNIVSLNDIAPGLRINAAAASANPHVYIRGVGLSDFNANASGGVGVYIDGVYIGSPLAQMSGFYDISQVEVLRGPQGSLYGRNNNGGAINITTNQPTQTYTADASLEYGNYNAVNTIVGFGGPIIPDTLAFRIAGELDRDDGYTKNIATGDEVNNTDHWGERGSLLFTPSSSVEILAQVNFYTNRSGSMQGEHVSLLPTTKAATGSNGLCKPSYYDSGDCTDLMGFTNSFTNPRLVDSNVEGDDKIDLFGSSVRGTWDLGSISLVSLSAFQLAHRNDMENTDASPLQMLEINYRSGDNQFSQELRAQSNDAESPLKWVTGFYYLYDSVNEDTSQNTLEGYRKYFISPSDPTGFNLKDSVADFTWPYTENTASYAVFGQADYNITDKLIATLGLRWSEDDKQFHYRSQADGIVTLLTSDQSKSFSAPSGRAALRYEFTPDLDVYASYNRGYKSGGFFGGFATTAAEVAPYKNETLDAYEVGVKSELFDHRLRFNADAFYYNYKNEQVFSEVVVDGVTQTVLTNAANSTIYGGEAEITTRPVSGLDLSAGLSLLHARYGTFESAGQDYSGNTLPQSPAITFNASATYTYPLASGAVLIATANTNFSSKVFFDDTNSDTLAQGPVWLTNAQVGWQAEDGGLELGLFVRNLFDKTYVVAATSIESLGEDVLTLDQPRYFGAFVRYHY